MKNRAAIVPSQQQINLSSLETRLWLRRSLDRIYMHGRTYYWKTRQQRARSHAIERSKQVSILAPTSTSAARR
uniref:Uncharacterized protein n=1 Tax=Trichogramma kaykai TaxID=54128 RepID=A0ABD2XH07_9HYME